MSERMIQQVNEQRGIVLILSLLVMTILSVLGLAFLATARTEDTIASNYRNHTAAFYAAEAGLESGVASLKSLLGTKLTALTDQDLQDLSKNAQPTLTDPNYTFDAFQVARVRTAPPYNYQTTLTNGAYAGLNALTTNYVITATVRGPRGSRAQLTQTVQYLQIPLFQFNLFAGKGIDVEMTPGPAATIKGRIHTNSNLYLGGKTGIKVDSYVTSTGKIFRHGFGDMDRETNPQIKDANGNYQTLNFDHEYDFDFQNKWSPEQWRQAALKTFGGRVQDGAMGVQEIIPPIPSAFYDPDRANVSSHLIIEKGDAADSPELKDAKLYYQADLRIENGSVKKKDGSPVNLTAEGCDPKTITTKTFYDAREKAKMTVTEVDIGKLKDCGKAPANGILYVSKGGANGGVRLVNGAELPSQGLTVISENPAYVMGDYNTVNKVPAAVLADAVTVLSNAWAKNEKDYDKQGDEKTSKRKAEDTTVNAAFASGPSYEMEQDIVRLLEDWKTDGQKTLNYNGSTVALWLSQQTKGHFRCCGDRGDNYYRPPIRNFNYDTLFDTNPPPGTPMGIIIMRGPWSQG